ncbi:MAG: hypothetical protein AAF138_10010 [Planctomycetota bacterium]
MRILAYLLIAISLAVGAASATNAYLWTTDLPAEAFEDGTRADGTTRYVELAAPAGDNGFGGPIVPASTLDARVEITPEVLATLRNAGVDNVRVKNPFVFSRWRGRWTFIGAAIGLVAGAFMVRLDAKRALEAQQADATGDTMSPEKAVGAMRATLAALTAEIDAMDDESARNAAIVHRLDETQREHVPAVVEGRTRLIGAMGLGHYAEFMDQFSAFERQINRAWSAAADGVNHEAETCITRAEELLHEVESRLPTPPAPPPALTTPPSVGSTPAPAESSIASPALPLASAGSAVAAESAGEAADPLADLGIEIRKDDYPTPPITDPYSVQELAEEDGDDDEPETPRI